MASLRWKSHDSHIDILKEFYYFNKYYMTEQLKDSILDAIECLEYIEKHKICDNETCKDCSVFGWVYDFTGENPNGFWTCEMNNTKVAVPEKITAPTREDFIKSNIIFREPKIKEEK